LAPIADVLDELRAGGSDLAELVVIHLEIVGDHGLESVGVTLDEHKIEELCVERGDGVGESLGGDRARPDRVGLRREQGWNDKDAEPKEAIRGHFE
jgi:hypothetical protein